MNRTVITIIGWLCLLILLSLLGECPAAST
jgi:hypothetical protein